LIVFEVFFYRAGKFEGGSGLAWAWAGLLVLVSVAIWRWFGKGFLAVLLGQVGLFTAITFYRMCRK
jgi:hypothetical protein